jgi:hypothetical protein
MKPSGSQSTKQIPGVSRVSPGLHQSSKSEGRIPKGIRIPNSRKKRKKRSAAKPQPNPVSQRGE